MSSIPIGSKFHPARRVAGIGVSEILRIGATARQMKREGRPVIVLAAGEPDFDTPDNVKEAAYRAIRDGATKYTTLDGTQELKAAIANKFRRDNRLDYKLDEICASAGAKQVIHNALLATLDEGDEVILPAPYWTSYVDMVTLAGGTVVSIPCCEKKGFRLDASDFERAITPRTRWLILNSPANPTGTAYAYEHLRPILDVLLRYPHVWLIADDIYEHLSYDGFEFCTPAEVEPLLRERTLTVNGVSKAYAMTGWRLGFAGGPRALIGAMAVVQSQSTTNPCSISQAAAIEALRGPQAIVAQRRLVFQRRRDLVVDALNAIDNVCCRRPDGAFYVFASCSRLLGRRAPSGRVIDSDVAFCHYLLEEHEVAIVPGVVFGLASYFRLSYAAAETDLNIALARIAEACRVLQ